MPAKVHPNCSYRRLHAFPRGNRMAPKRLFMHRKSVHIKRYLLQNPWSRPMTVFNYAVIKIQQVFRGFLIRKYGAKRNIALQLSSTRNAKYRRIRKGKPLLLDKYLKDLESYKYIMTNRPSWINEGFSSWCAVRLQSVWRMAKAYRRVSYRRFPSFCLYMFAVIYIDINS